MAIAPTLSDHRILSKANIFSPDDLKQGVMVLVDKPFEWTSFDVINKIRSSIKHGTGIKKIKVGHAGTLDPMATGLLLVCIGKYTKLIDSLTSHSKTYLAEFKFGYTTASYDQESEEENEHPIHHLSEQLLKETCKTFMGEQMQIPPIFSAIKVNGESAHRLARRGKEVTLKERPIYISNFELQSFDLPKAHFEIECSKGTYIRSIAHDFGQTVDCGAYLSALQRTKVDEYHVDKALSVEEVVNWINELPVQSSET